MTSIIGMDINLIPGQRCPTAYVVEGWQTFTVEVGPNMLAELVWADRILAICA